MFLRPLSRQETPYTKRGSLTGARGRGRRRPASPRDLLPNVGRRLPPLLLSLPALTLCQCRFPFVLPDSTNNGLGRGLVRCCVPVLNPLAFICFFFFTWVLLRPRLKLFKCHLFILCYWFHLRPHSSYLPRTHCTPTSSGPPSGNSSTSRPTSNPCGS